MYHLLCGERSVFLGIMVPAEYRLGGGYILLLVSSKTSVTEEKTVLKGVISFFFFFFTISFYLAQLHYFSHHLCVFLR